jgi:ABC-type Mn2+/Zn2+ transport system permease subunit
MIWKCCILAVVCTIAFGPIANAVPPATTRAAEDPVTSDIEKDILGAPPGPKPNAEVEARLQAPPGDDDSRPRTLEAWIRVFIFSAPALIVGAGIGISCSILGVFVILRREALLALALPQVVAMGAAVAMLCEWPTLPPALVAAMLALVALAIARRRGLSHWVLPALYISGLSVSFLIIANHGQDVADLQHLLTGIDVAVTPARAAIAAPILIVTGIVAALLWRRWLLLAQAPAAAELAGVQPARWDSLFLSLLALVLLLGTDSQGVVMVLAMLFLPAAAVLPWARRIPTAMVGSLLIALMMLFVGFVFSNEMKWPMSQSVGGAGFVVMSASNVIASLKR